MQEDIYQIGREGNGQPGSINPEGEARNAHNIRRGRLSPVQLKDRVRWVEEQDRIDSADSPTRKRFLGGIREPRLLQVKHERPT